MAKPDGGQHHRVVGVNFRTARFSASWREEALVRICELRALISSFRLLDLPAPSTELLDQAATELEHASEAASRRLIIRGGRVTGSAVQRVHGHLDTAEALVLRAAPSEYVRGQTPAWVAYIRRHLVPSHPCCQAAEQVLRAERIGAHPPGAGPGSAPAPGAGTDEMSADNRAALVAAAQAAMAEARNEQMRVRSFRNILLIFATLLVCMAIGVCVLALVAPDRIPVCFEPVQAASGQAEARRLVCPTGESALPPQADVDQVIADTAHAWDVPLIELLGLIAAAIAATMAFRKVRGTNMPYSLPATLAMLKLPLGALTALLGLLLMRGNFIPGLSALDNSAQIIGWAVVFGYAQQAFTQVVDRKTQDVLDDIGSADQREKPVTVPAQQP